MDRTPQYGPTDGMWVKLEDVEDLLILPISNSEVVAILRSEAVTMEALTHLQRHNALLDRIKKGAADLQVQLDLADQEFGAPDLFYRFYTQSFKTFRIQQYTAKFMECIQTVAGDEKLHPWFLGIIAEGTDKVFDLSHNNEWLKHTRPMMEAYFHSRMVVEQMLWCSKNLTKAENWLDSPWAAVLTIYNLR